MPLSKSEQDLCNIISSKREALLEDLRLHVETPTGPGSIDGIDKTRRLLTDRLVALGATHERVATDERPDWLWGASVGRIPDTSVCDRRSGAPAVLIAGHMDTVHHASSPFCELTVSPDAKTATGPGCVDMKGGLVIAVAALEALQADGIDASWTFTLNADEETGTYGSERALRNACEGHDFAIALEPALADGSLAIERMGSGQFLIEAHGTPAHVGREFEKGVSAVSALARSLTAAAELPDPDRGMILSVGPLEGGGATNAVPDLARAWGNVRFKDHAAMEELGAKIDALEHGGDAESPRIRVKRSFNRIPKPETPAVRAFALAARGAAEDLGQQLPFAKTGGVCDGNILQDAGLPTIDTLGVRGGGLHTPDEWIDLSSLVERCQLLAVLISRICRGEVSAGG